MNKVCYTLAHFFVISCLFCNNSALLCFLRWVDVHAAPLIYRDAPIRYFLSGLRFFFFLKVWPTDSLFFILRIILRKNEKLSCRLFVKGWRKYIARLSPFIHQSKCFWTAIWFLMNSKTNASKYLLGDAFIGLKWRKFLVMVQLRISRVKNKKEQ